MSYVLPIVVFAGLVAAVCFGKNRAAVSVLLLAIAAFCGFGFLASFEFPGVTPWKIGYGLASVSCLLGAAWPWVANRNRKSASRQLDKH